MSVPERPNETPDEEVSIIGKSRRNGILALCCNRKRKFQIDFEILVYGVFARLAI